MRLIMDNNVWAAIARTGSKAALEHWSADHGWKICTPPATLLEMLRDSNMERLTANVSALMSKHWVRLRTEADMECAEVVAEAKRLRPGWVRQVPLPAEPASLRAFWTHQIWRYTASNPARHAAERQPIARSTEYLEQAAYKVLKANRDGRIQQNFQVGPLHGIVVAPTDDAPDDYLLGWDERQPVEAWRLEARDVYRMGLKAAGLRRMPTVDTTYADWIHPFLWPHLVTRDWADFTRFWLFDVDKINMPRNWIRWAISTAQLMSKVKQSDLRDGQLAAYLVDCDVFLTEDRRFANALEKVKASCPVAMADIRHIKIATSNAEIVDIIEAALT